MTHGHHRGDTYAAGNQGVVSRLPIKWKIVGWERSTDAVSHRKMVKQPLGTATAGFFTAYTQHVAVARSRVSGKRIRAAQTQFSKKINMRSGSKRRQILPIGRHQVIATDIIGAFFDLLHLQFDAWWLGRRQHTLPRLQHQPLNRLTAYHMVLKNFVDILAALVVIPDSFRVNHHDWPQLTAVETATLIDSNAFTQFQHLATDFHVRLQLTGTPRTA